METRQAILARRSVRSFSQEPLERGFLEDLVAVARLSPAAANLQPLEYVVVTQPELCEEIFGCLKWAAYTAPVGTPTRPIAPPPMSRWPCARSICRRWAATTTWARR